MVVFFIVMNIDEGAVSVCTGSECVLVLSGAIVEWTEEEVSSGGVVGMDGAIDGLIEDEESGRGGRALVGTLMGLRPYQWMQRKSGC
jgi:hypothetical protein